MDWDKWKTRFGQDSIKVFLGVAVISAIGLGAYAVLQEPPALPDGNVVSVISEEFEEVKGVKLIPADPELPARTTFRVQFDNSIIKPEQVDQAGQMNPLVFEPPLKGEFIWDSTRSGAFTPASGFALDARIQRKPAGGRECARTGAVPNKFTFQWRLKNQRVHLPGLVYLFRFDDRIIKLHTKGRARGQLRVSRNELHTLHLLELFRDH